MKTLTKQFTLIELMIVVAIIAIIATIAIPQLISARKNSNERAAIANLRSVLSDQETYMNENNIYATLDELANDGKAILTETKAGYDFSDIISVPTKQFYAVLASPAVWPTSGSKHFACTVAGKVRVDTNEVTDLDENNTAEYSTIEAIEEYPEAK